MKTLFITTLFSLSFFSCAQESVRGNGNFITETRNVSADFNEIESAGAFDIIINDVPQDGKIKLEGESNILDKIEVEVQGNTLVIQHKQGYNFFNNSGSVKVSLNARNLKSLGLSGSGSITAKGIQKVDDFSASLSGSGEIDAKVSAQNVNAAISGSGDIRLSGDADKFKVGISGSGDVKAFALNSKDAEIAVSGSGDTEITVNGNLTASVAGSGDIHYKGNPAKINAQSGGSGDVIDAN
ncbi:MAG TPA: head GIN domain-containing protein [Moheibacter sp.]|nr:head GIN domain-containing protein [Moheibacter sp.]